MSDRKCKNCKYYEEDITEDKDGICHRFPPEIIYTHSYGGKKYFQNRQPEVYEGDWCGEFEECIESSLNYK